MESPPELLKILIGLTKAMVSALVADGAVRHWDKLFPAPRYPGWIYGIYDAFRYRLATLGVFGSILSIIVGSMALWEATRGMGILSLALGAAGVLILGSYASRAHRRRREFEQTYDHGTLIVARILEFSESLWKPAHALGDSKLGEQVARGAASILRGTWTITIRFELKGRQIESRRRVPPTTFYRFHDCREMPILVRNEAPDAWIPRFSATG